MIKGTRSIAEYAIRKWLQGQGFVMEYFELTVSGNIGTLTDRTGEKMTLVYDSIKNEFPNCSLDYLFATDEEGR